MSSVLSRAVGLLPGRGGPRPPDTSAVLSALPVPVILLDPDNRFRLVNHAAEQFLGISASHLAQMRLSDLVPQDSPLFLLIEQVRQTESSVANHDLTLDSPRLEKHSITAMGSPLSEEPGAVVLVLQDSSGALALDRQLAFRGAARSVTGMAAVLAHEVKNPLSGIRGAAQLLEASVVDADRELTVLIRDEADRIRALVDRMEAFSEKPISRTAVNIHRVLEHVRRLAQTGFARERPFPGELRPLAAAGLGQSRSVGSGGSEPREERRRGACRSRAGTATAHPEIVLTTGFQHGMRIAVPGTSERVNLPLYVAIRDNGPGIPEDIRPHLFEPFVTSKASGSGLGLSLVAKIIGDHGGLIEVDSKPGRTEFRLHLPVVTEKDDD